MAGHSHWSNIKRKKEKKDKKRSKKFSRLSKMIITAVRENNGEKDPDMNPTLATAIEKAKEEDMPKENIEKAIKKGAGEGEEGALEDFVLEVYGPNGLAVILQGATDNKNRTVSQINQILKRAGGKLAKPGSVTWLFDRKGVIEIEKSEENELIAIESGAEDIDYKNDTLLVYTAPDELNKVKKNIKEKLEIESASLGYKPKTDTVSREDYENFLEKLEDHEEIDQVYFTVK
ncbi:MAG: YebC/PmpR family DNA-binding transcriptional regulator [Patescibacteria group bacterium]